MAFIPFLSVPRIFNNSLMKLHNVYLLIVQLIFPENWRKLLMKSHGDSEVVRTATW